MGPQTTGSQILRVDQDRLTVRHAPVAVALLVDHRVVLAVTAGGDQVQHQALLAGGQAAEVIRIRQSELGQRRHRQLGPASGGGETGPLEHPAGHLEFLLAGVDLGDGGVTGHGAGDQLAHIHGILQPPPVDRLGAVQAVGQLGQELHLADQLAAGQMGAAGLIEPHPVVARFHRGAVGRLEAVEHRQQQGLARRQAVEVAGVGLGGQVDDRVDAAKGCLGLAAVGVGAVQVAAQTEQGVDGAGSGRLDQGAGVVAPGGAEGPAEQLLKRQPHRLAQIHRHPHRAEALHVGVAADRHRARPRPGHVAREHGRVGDRLHVGGAVGVVGDAHRPGEHHRLARSQPGSGVLQLLAAEAAAARDRLPAGGLDLLDQGLPAVGMGLHEVEGDGATLQQGLLQPQKHGGVGAGNRLQEQGGDLTAAAEHRADREGGRAELEQPRLQHRIDHDHRAAALAQADQLVHQPRVVCRRIGAHQHHSIGLLEALEAHHRGAAAKHPAEADAGGGVAEVGAVGQIVGAESPQQQLQQVGGLIGGAPGAVRSNPLRRRPSEGRGAEVLHFFPADRLVVVAAGSLNQGSIEPAQLVAFGGAELLELGQAAAGKHLRWHRRLQFRSDRLHTLEAALQGLTQFIAKAAVLAARAPGATQAGAFVVEGLP